jgi:hypothetical protein
VISCCTQLLTPPPPSPLCHKVRQCVTTTADAACPGNSVIATSALLLLLVACAGAGIGMFTTEPVSVGQLLLVSQPLATVTLNSAAAASG